MRSLAGFSEMILEDYGDKLDEQGRDYLERVRQASQLMARLIDNMLRLSHIGRADMYRDKVNLSAIAKSIAKELQDSQPDRQAEFIIPQNVIVNGDGNLLTIALRNLLENAWKFTGKCPETKIEFGITIEKGQQVYFIRDNGAGFDMRYAGKLFQPFQRLHSDKEYRGTGIGLATVQRIIRRHGGKIWAEAENGQGAAFYFTLR
jgi:light-regulated signal transduction histidine kinase (bacteriophytochrome)